MPIRIYALAKQLKVDSKSMVDICTQAGVTGKGSALASLTDEEVEKVKALIAGGGRAGGKTAKPAPATRKAPKPSTPPSEGAVRREDYIAPAGTTPGKVPLLPDKPAGPSAPKKKPPGTNGPGSAAPEKGGPAIKLAPMPAAQQPPPTKKTSEPAPQRPDIKLPLDAIRAGKAGTKPLVEHIKEQEKGRKAPAARKATPKKPGAVEPVGPGGPLPADREHGRRGPRKGAAAGKDEPVTLGGREQRQLKRKRAPARRRTSGGSEDRESGPRRRSRRIRRTGTNTAAPRKSNVVVQLPCSVKAFSEAVGISAAQVLGKYKDILHRRSIKILF